MPTIPPRADGGFHPDAAVMAGVTKCTNIGAPILAIFALPHNPGRVVTNDPNQRTAFKEQEAIAEAQAKAFEEGLPPARVVRDRECQSLCVRLE